MENSLELQIVAILKEKRSAEAREADLSKIIIEGNCQRKYYEEDEPWPACYPFNKYRGVVEYYNCDDSSENRIIYGEWHCKGS